MVYGILNAATGEFRYVSAGHPGPVHLPCGADPVILESQGFPIGLADDAYEERSVRLEAGDRLYLYSDGVPEAMDPAGKQFGDARLLECDRPRAVRTATGRVLLPSWRRSRGGMDPRDLKTISPSWRSRSWPHRAWASPVSNPLSDHSLIVQRTQSKPRQRLW